MSSSSMTARWPPSGQRSAVAAGIESVDQGVARDHAGAWAFYHRVGFAEESVTGVPILQDVLRQPRFISPGAAHRISSGTPSVYKPRDSGSERGAFRSNIESEIASSRTSPSPDFSPRQLSAEASSMSGVEGEPASPSKASYGRGSSV